MYLLFLYTILSLLDQNKKHKYIFEYLNIGSSFQEVFFMTRE